MSEANKELMRQIMAEVDRRHEMPEEFLAPGFSMHMNGDPPMGAAEFKGLAEAFFSAFPDLRHNIDVLVAEGDTVAVRGTIEGTHQGSFMDLPPTGKRIKVNWSAIFRIADGKLAEEHIVLDQMGMMQQLGAIPAPAQAAT